MYRVSQTSLKSAALAGKSETGLTSAVRRQDTWTHKYPTFGSIYRQINIYFYKGKCRSKENASF